MHYRSGGGADRPLVYDAACAGANRWRYDDPAAPQAIELCDSTCATVQADPAAALEVEFACQQLISVD